MINITNSVHMAEALASPIDVELKRLLALHCERLLEHQGYDLGEMAHFIVADPADTIHAVEAVAGVAITGEHPFEIIEDHGSWLEAIMILSDDGFGIVLLVPAQGDPALLALLREHA